MRSHRENPATMEKKQTQVPAAARLRLCHPSSPKLLGNSDAVFQAASEIGEQLGLGVEPVI